MDTATNDVQLPAIKIKLEVTVAKGDIDDVIGGLFAWYWENEIGMESFSIYEDFNRVDIESLKKRYYGLQKKIAAGER
jgi:hypothetical protein